MKIRNDFVSNSSSCSFVIAINKEYKLKDFIKDLAKECSNPKSKYHNEDIVDRNKRILDFCLNTYELAFLGSWKLRTDEKVYTKEDFNDLFVGKNDEYELSDDEKKLFLKEADEHWQYEIDCIEKAKKPDCDPMFKKLVDKNYLSEDRKCLHIFNDIYAGNCAVNSDTMRYDFSRYGYESDNDKNAVKIRIENLKKLAKEYADHENGNLISYPYIACYAITLNTINNTRDLINAGYDLEIDDNLDIDKLEKRLNAGEQIFCIHIGHDGEGYGDFEIYCEENADGLDNIAAEILDSEPM